MVPRCRNKSPTELGDEEGHGSTRAAVPRAAATPLRAHPRLEMAAGNGPTPAKPTALHRERGAGCAGGCSTPAELRPGGAKGSKKSWGERREGLGEQRVSGFPEIPTGIPVCPVIPSDSRNRAARYLPGTAVTKRQLLHRALSHPNRRGMPRLGRSRMGEAGDFPPPSAERETPRKKKPTKLT